MQLALDRGQLSEPLQMVAGAKPVLLSTRAIWLALLPIAASCRSSSGSAVRVRRRRCRLGFAAGTVCPPSTRRRTQSLSVNSAAWV